MCLAFTNARAHRARRVRRSVPSTLFSMPLHAHLPVPFTPLHAHPKRAFTPQAHALIALEEYDAALAELRALADVAPKEGSVYFTLGKARANCSLNLKGESVSVSLHFCVPSHLSFQPKPAPLKEGSVYFTPAGVQEARAPPAPPIQNSTSRAPNPANPIRIRTMTDRLPPLPPQVYKKLGQAADRAPNPSKYNTANTKQNSIYKDSPIIKDAPPSAGVQDAEAAAAGDGAPDITDSPHIK